jgi:cobaltochelatase CobN
MRQYSPEYDLLDCGCYAGFLGGMAVAAKAVGGKATRVYWADVNAAGDLSVRDVKDDIETSARARLLNKEWIANQKKHGYKGTGGVSSRVNNLFKWSATTGKVEKWLYDEVVDTYIHDRENLEWLRNENPYALEELSRRLLEAESRGLWEANPEALEAIRQAALIVEGDMEEIMGEVQEEFQGSKIDVMTASRVEKWQPKWRMKEKTE